MKAIVMVAAVVGMIGLAGCMGQQGGPPGYGQGFKLEVPMFDMTVRQGETETAKIKVDRGKYFKQDVTLSLKTTEGITVSPTEVTVKAEDKADVAILVTAPKTAAIGSYRVYVTATPSAGEAVKREIKVNVKGPPSSVMGVEMP